MNPNGRQRLAATSSWEPDEFDLLGCRLAMLARRGQWDQAAEMLAAAHQAALDGVPRHGLDSPLADVIDRRTAAILDGHGIVTVRDVLGCRREWLLGLPGIGPSGVAALRSTVALVVERISRGSRHA